MVTRSFLFPRVRAAIVGWLPASALFGLALLVDGATFGFLLGPIGFFQALYLACAVAVAGFVLSPIIGFVFGFPLLVLCESIRAPLVLVAGGAVAGGIFAGMAFGARGEGIAAMALAALVCAACSWFSWTLLERDLRLAHAT